MLLLATMTIAVLAVSGAMLFGMGKPAQSQETTPPCNVDYCIDKTADADTVEVGQQITFTITQRCFSLPVCFDVFDLVDELPSGLTIASVEDTDGIINPTTGVPDPSIDCTGSGNTVTCPGTRLITPTRPFTVTIVATTTECGEFTNTASVPGRGDGLTPFSVPGAMRV